MKKLTTYLIILLSFTTSLQATESGISDQLTQCKTVKNDIKRLQCFDQIELKEDHALQNRANNETSPAQLINNQPIVSPKPSAFPALIADLDEPSFFISYGNLDFLGSTKKAVLLGGGKRHAVKTFDVFSDSRPLSLNVFGQIRSQFDVDELDTRNNRGGALINTDFSVGGELVQSLDNWNWRFSYMHRSTHLGDEFIIDNPNFLEDRLNLSYETVRWTAHKAIKQWDLYAGVGFITRAEPSNLDKSMWQLGWQYQGNTWRGIKPIWAVDLNSWGAYDWNINVNMRAGIEISQFSDTPFQLLFEYQDGHSPYGQFFTEDLTFAGLTFLQNW